ncbi:MAG: methyltransferase domain-containing protein [Pseudomonadota bacterium]
MKTNDYRPRRLQGAALVAAAVLLFWLGQTRLRIDADITAALPRNDPVAASAQKILEHHPALENVFIDLSLKDGTANRETLAAAAKALSRGLDETGLVRVVTGQGAAEAMPTLFNLVVEHLPLFFSRDDLEKDAAPLLDPPRAREILKKEFRDLYQLGGIGQARTLARDPLGLRNLVLPRLAALAPPGEAEIFRGEILSRDGRRALVIATPSASARDAEFAGRLTAALDRLQKDLAQGFRPVKIVYAGSFRAALDNESVIRRDAFRAMLAVTLGVIVLCGLGFSRPWVGLLSLVPAALGGLLAVFVYSLLRDSIAAVSLGFGGALVSITVDHGLAWALQVDQPFDTDGRRVSHEVWSVSSFTVYTTAAALASLLFSGIPLLEEVGLFAALGVLLSALTVHLFFPLVFPRIKGSGRRPLVSFGRLVNPLLGFSSLKYAFAAGLVGLGLLFFARLDFSGDLEAMNTVRPETLAAEETIKNAWGDLSGRVYVMAQGATVEELRGQAEVLTAFLKSSPGFEHAVRPVPLTAVLPGPREQRENLAAWKQFWTPARREELRAVLADAETGFSPDAFAPFGEAVENPRPGPLAIPESLYSLLGLFPDKRGGWLATAGLVPGAGHDPEKFRSTAAESGFSVFDSGHFSRHIAALLNSSFMKMLTIIGLSATVLLFFLFVDWGLLLLSLTPVVFSLVATLGTMGLLGLPLTIPSLMLAPVVVGLGLDYGLYLIRSHQRFGRADHPLAESFRGAVMLGGLSTLIGMGSLALSQHHVLKMAGISTFLGIGYALVGAFAFLPPFLRRRLATRPRAAGPPPETGSRAHLKAVLEKYRLLEPTPRFFARFKILLDPMFPRLAEFVAPGWTILDLGCGYGVPSAWLSVVYPDLRFFSLDPDEERVRAARLALGDAIQAVVGAAPDLPPGPARPDAAMMLDMVHYLDDDQLRLVLARLGERIKPGGKLIIRATLPTGGRQRWQRWLELLKIKKAGQRAFYRDREVLEKVLFESGFELELVEPAAPGREETWFIARNGRRITGDRED